MPMDRFYALEWAADPMAGDNICNAAKLAVQHAEVAGNGWLIFNALALRVRRGMKWEDVCDEYDRKLARAQGREVPA